MSIQDIAATLNAFLRQGLRPVALACNPEVIAQLEKDVALMKDHSLITDGILSAEIFGMRIYAAPVAGVVPLFEYRSAKDLIMVDLGVRGLRDNDTRD